MEHDYDAIARIVDYLSDPRESRSINDITAAAGLAKPDAKAALDALKEAKIVKVSGSNRYQKWYLDLDLDLPIELPPHLRAETEPAATTPPTDAAATDGTEPDTATGTDSEEAAPGNGEEPGSKAAAAADEAPAEPVEGDAVSDDHDEKEDQGAGEAGPVERDDAERSEQEGNEQGAVSEAETDGGEAATPDGDDHSTWTVGGPLERRKDAKFGLIDLEAMSVFHLLPAHDADSGVDMVYLDRMLGAGMSTTRIVKALWLMWEHGIAQAKGLWRPDRGEWKLTEGAQLEDLKAFAMSNAPRRVTCPDCGHDGALNYKPGKAGALQAFDPEAPAPEGFAERGDQDGHHRDPVVMFCALFLHSTGIAMGAKGIADFAGYHEPVVLRALWAMRACRIVECTNVRRTDGGDWKATETTFKLAPLAALTDAPETMGCGTCGQAIGTRGIGSGKAGGKATKGVSRAQTHDGGEPLPQGSLPIMIQAWAIHAPNLEPAHEGDDPTVRTPTKLLGDLQAACGSGRMVDWLAAWAELQPKDTAKVGAASEAIAKGGHPRSSGAVKNALFSLKGGGLIEEVREARVETYRSTIEAPDSEEPFDDEQDVHDDAVTDNDDEPAESE